MYLTYNIPQLAGRLYLDHDSVGIEPNRYILIKRRKPVANSDTKDKTEEDYSTESQSLKKKKEKYDKIPYGVSEILPG
jgi:hypothetical protein